MWIGFDDDFGLNGSHRRDHNDNDPRSRYRNDDGRLFGSTGDIRAAV